MPTHCDGMTLLQSLAMNEPLEIDNAQAVVSRKVLWFAVCYPTVLTVLYFMVLDGTSTVVQGMVFGIGKTIQFGLPAWIVLRVNKERLGAHRPRAAGVSMGVLFGLLAMALIVGIYQWILKPNVAIMSLLDEQVTSKVEGFQLKSVAAYTALAVFYCLIHSGMEEYYWRWFAFKRFLRHRSLGQAIAISSIGFMAHHVIVLGMFFGFENWMTYVFSIGVAIGGAAWAWLYSRSGNLYSAWISHAFVDAAIFWVGYDILFQ